MWILGVEEIQIDAKNHKVTVKGKKADPTKVAERLRKKSGKHVNLISPIPPKEEKKEEKKPEVKLHKFVIWLILRIENIEFRTPLFFSFFFSGYFWMQAPVVIEVVLKIFLHCEGCAKEVKHCIHKMEGLLL